MGEYDGPPQPQEWKPKGVATSIRDVTNKRNCPACGSCGEWTGAYSDKERRYPEPLFNCLMPWCDVQRYRGAFKGKERKPHPQCLLGESP